jgi:hypothetical protein
MASKLVDVVRQLATRRVDKFFHSASNTHIFYQPFIGPLGVKGVGDFSDEAFAAYIQTLDLTLKNLSAADLENAHRALLDRRPGLEQRREIQLEVPLEVKRWLESRAEAGNLALTEVVQMIVMESLPQDFEKVGVKTWYFNITNKSEALGQTRAKGRRPISIRLAPDKLGRIRQFASTVGERDSSLIKKVVLAGYVSENPRAAKIKELA